MVTVKSDNGNDYTHHITFFKEVNQKEHNIDKKRYRHQ